MPDRLERMLTQQTKLQERHLEKVPAELEGDELIQFLKDMKLALEAELQELMDETDWKPWTPGTSVNYLRAKQEWIDAWHFMMNIWLSLQGTPEQLFEMYLKKNEKNHQRLDTNYDGKSTKCAECHTDLDELPAEDQIFRVSHTVNGDLLRFCNMGHHQLYFERLRQEEEDAK